jgi:hypothetical protein
MPDKFDPLKPGEVVYVDDPRLGGGKRCSSCRWFVDHDGEWGECHYNAPRAGRYVWPGVKHNDFCKEWTGHV